MARRDGKGPNGNGPQTGRGLGYCGNNDNTEFNEKGYGRGNGHRNRFRFRNIETTTQDETQASIVTLLSEIKDILTKKNDSK
ncbi:DUF5320 domain-containing protein [bacterium]|nr:DUF5320 domain-containing protein [bacterium]